jgi:nuclear pore complex protein Nup93
MVNVREQERLFDGLSAINNETLPGLVIQVCQPGPYAEDDLEAFLSRHYEETMLGVIAEVQARVAKETDALIARAKEAAWERTRGLILEHRSGLGGGSTTTTKGTTAAFVAGGKGEAYGGVVKALNEARLSGSPHAPAFAFGAVARAAAEASADHRMEQLADCWETVGIVGGEAADADANVFLTAPRDDQLASLYAANGAEWRGHLILRSRCFLERAFVRFMDRTVAMYPREAMLGGRPSVVERVRAFLAIRLKRMSAAEASRLEMFPGAGALWPLLFFLVRGGCVREALHLAQQMDVQLSRAQPHFLAYLRAFAEGALGEQMAAQIRAEYAQLLLGPCDPYRLALLKVFGRCELARRSLPEIITSSEDYLWLQLWLVRPLDGEYDLAALQRTVLGYGPKHFDPKGLTPLRYFHVLLLVGLFEEAVGYLAGPGTGLDLEALHFAIALRYHGLLRASPSIQEWGAALLEDGSINYGALLSRYAKSLARVDATLGLHYVFALTLCKSYEEPARSLVRQMLLSAPADLGSLLGPASAASTGFLGRHAKLLGLAEPAQFLHAIVLGAGEIGEREGRWEDALLLFNWAGEHGLVLQLLAKRLLHLFSAAVAPSPEELSNAIGTAASILSYYRSLSLGAPLEGKLVHRVEMALGMCRLAQLLEAAQWAQAIALVEDSLASLVPVATATDADSLGPVTRLADAIKANRLDAHLLAALPTLLLHTMTALHAQFLGLRAFAAADPGRQLAIERVRAQARVLMVFLGLLGGRVSPDVCAQITRLDILMN